MCSPFHGVADRWLVEGQPPGEGFGRYRSCSWAPLSYGNFHYFSIKTDRKVIFHRSKVKINSLPYVGNGFFLHIHP
jgi:hypothetical protein